ncbi:hypothetical protein [Dysgonomonas sp. 511]|uniref:hypothetical protein n=1 Tax=Dysgonomonas sp. 511 TaxID=2302930 RepID=UPI0013D801C0|nr:hypothetical protein [Dysgonomonas sp. 511]
MKENKRREVRTEDFIGYEEARINKEDAKPVEATEKEVKAAVNRINLDNDTSERG